jgi:hypothetical protein
MQTRDDEVDSMISKAILATIFVCPRDPGLTEEELLEIGQRSGFGRGELRDGIERSTTHAEWDWKKRAPSNMSAIGVADFNFPWADDPRSPTAFEAVHMAMREVIKDEGAKAQIPRDELVATCVQRGSAREDVEAAITGLVLDEIFEEKDAMVGYRRDKHNYPLPSRQLRDRPEWFGKERAPGPSVTDMMPVVRETVGRRNSPAATRGTTAQEGAGMTSRSGGTALRGPVQASSAIRVFISHSSKDEKLAEAIVNLIQAGVEIDDKAIRCTSVDGYKLDPGDNTSSVLRGDISACDVLIGILTASGLESHYVLMELGAAWGFQKTAIPLVAPSVSFGAMPGPLSEIHAVKLLDSAGMLSVIDTVAKKTGLARRQNSAKTQSRLDAVQAAAKKTEEDALSPGPRAGASKSV